MNYRIRHPFLLKLLFFAICLAGLLFNSGCFIVGFPRARSGHLSTATHGIPFPDPEKLGKHRSIVSFGEVGGIVYTCKAGHIDIDHVRGNADNTLYLAGKIRKCLNKGSKGFSFSITGEQSKHKIRFKYPDNWKDNPDKEQIIDEIVNHTAPCLSYRATVWHEVLTWYGVHFMGFEPEFNSAFSWEDVYSNLLGTRLGVAAMSRTDVGFDKAMTEELEGALRALNVQPSEVARKASEKVKGVWYTGYFVPDVLKRNFDIGLDDGYVTPTLVSGISECGDVDPLPLPVPTLDVLRKHGFDMTHRIYPRVFEQGRIYAAAGTKKIYYEPHIPVIMKAIKKQARERGYLFAGNTGK